MNVPDRPKNKFWKVYDIILFGIVAFFCLLAVLSIVDVVGPNLNAAKRAKAANSETQITTACLGYWTEYGVMPESSENAPLKNTLCGDNPRKIEFLSLNPRDVGPNGEMIDPWGTPFRITFDSDSKVHVISAGPDKIFGSADDITNR